MRPHKDIVKGFFLHTIWKEDQDHLMNFGWRLTLKEMLSFFVPSPSMTV